MYRYLITDHFKRQLKPYAKKYNTILDDTIHSIKNFNPAQSVALGKNVYKLRMRILNLPKGKSNAFRMIILLLENQGLIAPLTIYFKGDLADISRREIKYHADIIRQEIESSK